MTDEAPRKHTRSISQFHTYAECGMRFKLERFDKVPKQPAAWLAQGIALHAGIEFWERSGREPGALDTTPNEVFASTYDRIIKETLDEWPEYNDWIKDGNRNTTTSITHRRELGLKHLDAYIAHALAAEWKIWELPDGEPGVEVGFRMEFNGVPVVGFIDKVIEWPNGAVTPRDYKSGAPPASPMQLGVYAVALNRMFNLGFTHGDYWTGSVVKKTGEIKGALPSIDLTRYTPHYLGDLFEGLEKGISSGIFLPNPGDHCRICPVQRSCPEMKVNQ